MYNLYEGWIYESKKTKKLLTFDTPGVYLHLMHNYANGNDCSVVGDDMSNLDDIKAMKLRGKSKKKMKGLLGDL